VENLSGGQSTISFRPLRRSDFPLLQRWLAAPHVALWWNERFDVASLEAKYGPGIDGREPIHVYLIQNESFPIGWIQWYRWRDFPEHAIRLGADTCSAGIDLAIGEIDMTGRGLGPMVIREFGANYIFVNGDVNVSSGSVTFTGGSVVYVNGNLTVGPVGQIVNGNTAPNEFVVTGNVVIVGAGAYTIVPKANSLMLALGSVTINAPNTASASPVGTIFAPNGTIDITGPGSIAGAFDAGADVVILGTNTATGMQYDTAQQATTIDTGALTFSSYIEY